MYTYIYSPFVELHLICVYTCIYAYSPFVEVRLASISAAQHMFSKYWPTTKHILHTDCTPDSQEFHSAKLSQSSTFQTFHIFIFAHTFHIAQGKTRAKQHFSGDTERKRCLSVVLHGDAAFAGQVNESVLVCCSE